MERDSCAVVFGAVVSVCSFKWEWSCRCGFIRGDVMMVQFQVVVESLTSVFVHVGSAVVLSVAVLWSEDGICLEVAEVDVEWYERGE